MLSSAYSPRSETSESSDPDGPSSKRLATENLSVILNIDKTVAKSRQIIQESLEVSRKNNERRLLLEERLKNLVAQNESSGKMDIVPKAYEEDVGEVTRDEKFSVDSMQPHNRLGDLRFRIEESELALERAESQVSDLRKKLSFYEHLDLDYDQAQDELKTLREDLRKERLKHRESHEITISKEKEQLETIENLESSLRRVKTELMHKEEDFSQLERAVRTADDQRAELLKESELLRQTLTDLKKLHQREIEELGKRVEDSLREKSTLERQLEEIREVQKAAVRKDQELLQTHVSQLESKLKDLEHKYMTQMTLNQDLQTQVKSLYESKSTVLTTSRDKEKLVQVFESQMQENTRRIDELQTRLNESTAKPANFEDDDDSLSNDELTDLIRREQMELGLSSVLKPKNSAKPKQKTKELQRVYSSGTRKRSQGKPEPQKRTASRCRYCHE